MPDVLRLRYRGAHPVTVPLVGREVQPEELVDLPGRAVTADELVQLGVTVGDDAFGVWVGNPPELRAMQLSLWSDETPVKTKKGD